MVYTWKKCQLFLSFKYTLSYGHTGKWSEDPKGGEQKADPVQMLRLEEGYADEFPGFLFCFICTRLQAGETNNIEIPMDTE